MIQVNLLPKEERSSEPKFSFQIPRTRVWLPAAVLLIVLLPLGGMYAMQRARINSLQEDIRQAEFELGGLKPQLEQIDRLTTEREQLNLRLSVVQGLCRERTTAVEIMDNLSDMVPEYLWLTKVEEAGAGQINLEGMTFSNLMIAELMSRMERSDVFDNVSLIVAERAKGGGSDKRPLLSFTLQSRITP